MVIGVTEIASGSRIAGVKNGPYQIGVNKAQIDAAMPVAPYVRLISIAIGFEALLLHGETRPFDVSSSQSNQRGFSREQRPCLRLKAVDRSGGGEGDHSLWPETSNFPEVLACDARTRFIQAQD
jgi:hypothetical protein